MAASAPMKPFSPEETRRILHHLQQPAVFLNMTCGWPVLHWTAEHLSGCLGDRHVRFRLGKKQETNTPLFETQCPYVEATVGQFLSWTQGQPDTDVGPFSEYSCSEFWAYADYKYIAVLFEDQPFMFEDVRWSEFGFAERNGRESTLWIGTEGANTPCHLDSYGCNLVLQVQGRKRWHLFPPEDTDNLYPTRIPYEESSVFSQVDVLHPDLRRCPAFASARPHVVTLQPGQVLYVPRHWWHYVESVDPITVSVNSWIELEEDEVARVSEAVTKTVVCAIKSSQSDDNTDNWLNPTETGEASHDENMQYLNLAVNACTQRRRGLSLTRDSRDVHPVKRDSSGQIKQRVRNSVPFIFPYGPHLIPVHCQREEVTPKDLEVNSSKSCAVTSQQDCSVSSAAAQRSTSAPAEEKQGRSSGLTQRGSRDCADGTSENPSDDYEELRHATITTNDLLECLVHPDIITRVTELLLERHTGSQRSTTPV
ncbi:HSPB1-associated protein 1 homolog isoform X2 [Parambassis ranga]|nr:HSPB1-associated protein 1 isoform X2 [Parambassis ranga]XP_028249091.1 HSPB1-associated protein 1 isoform X2 [Parambassis ranga]XP_028249092.1 HSPB1-associated protein 1 isoform X2 [Parambassis ranga]